MNAAEPLSVNVHDVIESIRSAVKESGLPSDAAATSYSVVDGFRDGKKTRTLEFGVTFKQSSYRPLDFSARKALEKRLGACLPGSRHHGPFVFEDSGQVVMKTRRGSFDRPIAVIIGIENDEPGRPTEVVTRHMFPEVRGHATAPLDALFGIYSPDRNAMGSDGGPLSLSAVTCAMVTDPIWETSDTPILPLADDGSTLVKHVESITGKVSAAHMIRAKSWLGVLRFAIIFDEYEKMAVERRKWVHEHGKYSNAYGGTSFSLPAGGPASPPSSATVRKLAAACARTLDDLSTFRADEAALHWDLQSLNTLKELQAMALGFLIDDQPSLYARFEPFRDASTRGRGLIVAAAWPL